MIVPRFLLVSLSIAAILDEATIRKRRERLDLMTSGLGLDGAYDATLDRIKGQGKGKSVLGMAALMWISCSERPMRIGEVCDALAVEIGSRDMDCDNIPSEKTLLASCSVFSTGQSVRPGAGRWWTAFSGPVRSFPKVAPRPTAKDRFPRRPRQSAKE